MNIRLGNFSLEEMERIAGVKHSTTLVNSVGLLDYDYRGELIVKLICFSNIPPEIKAGTAVA